MSNVDCVYHFCHDDRIGNDVPGVMPSNNHIVQDYDFDDINIDHWSLQFQAQFVVGNAFKELGGEI